MKRIDFPFPNELRKQIKTLNSLYNVIIEQRFLLENNDFENLNTNRSKLNKLTEVMNSRREQLINIENDWDSVEFDSPELETEEINGLINQLSDLMHQIIEIEHHNSSILEASEQKLDELLQIN